MTITTSSSREFNQDASGAERVARADAVFTTDRGRPSHALLTTGEYRRLDGQQKSIVERLADLDAVKIEFEVLQVPILVRNAGLS